MERLQALLSEGLKNKPSILSAADKAVYVKGLHVDFKPLQRLLEKDARAIQARMDGATCEDSMSSQLQGSAGILNAITMLNLPSVVQM